MGSGVNKVFLIGHLGADPEVRYTPAGQAVGNFRIATTEKWNDKSGQAQERTEWHRIVVWGKLAELCGEYLKKGRQCHIEGKLQTREWTDKESVKHYTTEIVANNVVFLGGGAKDAGAGDDESSGGGRSRRTSSGASGGGRSSGKSQGQGAGRSADEDDFGPPPPGMGAGERTGGNTGGGQQGGGGDDDIPF